MGVGGSLAGFDSILRKCESYSATTRTGALGRRLSNHKVFFESKRFSNFLQTDQ